MNEQGPRDSLFRQHPGQGFGAAIPREITPEFVRSEVARGRAIIRPHQPSRGRTDDHRPQLLVKITRTSGNSAVRRPIDEEVEKNALVVKWGATR